MVIDERIFVPEGGKVFIPDGWRTLANVCNLYPDVWREMFLGQGDSVLCLGAGPGVKEVILAWSWYQDQQQNEDGEAVKPLTFYLLDKQPYDKPSGAKGRIEVVSEQVDLGQWDPGRKYSQVRVATLWGVLDYLPHDEVATLLQRVAAIKPRMISIRICTTQAPWESQFAAENADVLSCEQQSIEAMEEQIVVVQRDDFVASMLTLQIPEEKKVNRGLNPDYAATYFRPNMLMGYVSGLGYRLDRYACFDYTGGGGPISTIMVNFVAKMEGCVEV